MLVFVTAEELLAAFILLAKVLALLMVSSWASLAISLALVFEVLVCCWAADCRVNFVGLSQGDRQAILI